MKAIFLFVVILIIADPIAAQAQKAIELDPVMMRELKKLEETWHVLDVVADGVWPGWSGYADIPYMFTFQNDVKILVGFADPPPGFELVPGVEVAGKAVHIDRRNEVSVKLNSPTNYGGGLSSMNSANNERVKIVSIDVRAFPSVEEGTPANNKPDHASENDILLNVHELFHAFQSTFYVYKYGNLRYVPDADYAIYSEIEGRALQRAFREESDAEALEYLKDFVVARKLKYRSMAPLEQEQEKEEDFNEGTAKYSEFAALQILSEGFRPAADEKELPYYFGFNQIDYFLDKELQSFDGSIQVTFHPSFKCYYYGCFQALLLDRFVPGWKKTINETSGFMYDIITGFLSIGEEEEARVASRLTNRYDYEAVAERQGGAIEERDSAFDAFYAREGRVYIINFKYTYEFPDCASKDGTESFTMGLRNLYPQGIEPLQIQEITLECPDGPILRDQIYHFRYIGGDNETYDIQFSEVQGDVYHDAVVSTDGFTLKAPKIRVKERGERVKFIILSKVGEQ